MTRATGTPSPADPARRSIGARSAQARVVADQRDGSPGAALGLGVAVLAVAPLAHRAAHPGVHAARREQVAARRPPPSAGDHGDHADAHVERRSSSPRATSPSSPISPKTGCGRPGRRGRPSAATSGGQHPRQVGGEPAAGDVAERVHVDSARRAPAPGSRGRRCGSARAAPRRACGRARRRAGRGASRAGAQQHVPDQRVAVGVQPAAAAWRRRRRRRAPAPAPSSVVGLDDPGARAGHVVLVGRQQAGVLGGLAADQRAAGLRGSPRRCRRRSPRSARGRPCRRRCSRS